MTTQLLEEIISGASIEVTLAKYIGLSLTKSDVQFVKRAVKAKDEKQIDLAITSIMHKHQKRKLLI
jgi:hypothetical protein